MKLLYQFFLLVLITYSQPSSLFGENPIVYINGSSTLANMVLIPHEEEIEKKASVDLKILANGSGYGLRDLALGRCDIAMISGPLQSIADNLNEHVPDMIQLNKYQEFKLGESSVVFIVNKQNPIDYLSSSALRRICIGEVLNWKDVGGNDLRIIVFTMERGVGVRTIVQDILLKGDFWGVYTTALANGHAMNYMVRHLPEAIGTNNIDEVDDTVKVLKTDIAITQPLTLVTKINPSPEILALINFIKDAANEELLKTKNKEGISNGTQK